MLINHKQATQGQLIPDKVDEERVISSCLVMSVYSKEGHSKLRHSDDNQSMVGGEKEFTAEHPTSLQG